VAFDIGGLGQLGADGAARIARYPDTAALFSAVEEVLDSPTLASQLVHAARRRAGAQLPEIVVPRFVDEVRRLSRSSITAGGSD
jgi:hypothetical protein